MGRRCVTLTYAPSEGSPGLVSHTAVVCCLFPGRSKPAAELHSNTPCSYLSETKGTEVIREARPTGSLSTVPGRLHNRKDSKLAQLEDPPL